METGSEIKTAPVRAEAMLRFAAHVRDSGASEADADRLAAEFGLPDDVVREALRYALRAKTRSKNGAAKKKPRERVAESASGVTAFIERHPLLMSGGISLIFFSVFYYLSRYAGAHADLVTLVVLLTGYAGLMAVNFIRGQTRYAMLTSAVAVMGSLVSGLAIKSIWPRPMQQPEPVGKILFGSVALYFFLVAFSMIASIFGALYKIRKQVRAEQRQDRLALLQRVFDLQERLAAQSSEARQEMRLRSMLRTARAKWAFVAIGAGAFLGIFEIVQVVTVGMPGQNPTFLQLAFTLLSLVLDITIFPAIGFISGNWLRGFASGALALSLTLSAWLIPLPGMGWESLFMAYAVQPVLLANLGILLFMAAIGGLGASIDDRYQHRARLQTADQSALLTEIIRLQQMLETGTADVCVMVVDCVQSTNMKKNADPLAVEISFREFHEFVAREVLRNGGTIHSTAGDGAVAEFARAASAFSAARSIQTLVPEFNNTANKLKSPFRLRIGLHCGSVHGGLETVLFTSVIDIAAHIEKLAPAGGIIVSSEVRDSLPSEKFARLAEQVDGTDVYVALSPTLD